MQNHLNTSKEKQKKNYQINCLHVSTTGCDLTFKSSKHKLDIDHERGGYNHVTFSK